MSSRIETSEHRWLERLEQLFFETLSQPVGTRERFLDDACGSDVRLRSSLEAMLRADQDHTGLIDTGPWHAPHALDRIDLGGSAGPGTRIGAYELIDKLGDGGMGTVWRARQIDEGFQRIVAIKLIRRGMNSEGIVRRFHRERQILARLEHPHIARLYDTGATKDGHPYLVMECLEGMRLHDFCRSGDLTVDQVLGLFRKVCEAVHFAHTNLVLHRDIKPGNVLVTSAGHPKLLDFGIARLLEGDAASVTTTAEHPVFTPRYASPEQVRGERLSTASDIYALGVLLYELLTGQSPYGGMARTRHEVEQAVLHETPAPPSSAAATAEHLSPGHRRDLARRLRGDLDAIVARAIHKSPGQRYASAEQLAEDLRRAQEGLPLLARGPGLLRRIGRVLARNRRRMIAMSGVALSAVVLTTSVVTYALLSPQWAREHVRTAHRKFLTPDFSNEIWVLTFNNHPDLFSRDARPACPDVAWEAIAAYDAALRFDAGLDSVRIERDTVWLAAEISANQGARPDPPETLIAAAPLTCEYAAAWAESGVVPDLPDERLDQAGDEDLRCLGLLAMLCRSERDCLRAWSRMGAIDQDPLVEGLIGVLYLALDQPELAYPPLQSAYRAFPELGYLCTYLADAALRCGNTALAGHLIDRAAELEHLDPLDALKRVRLQYYLATDQDALAATLFFEDGGWANHVTRIQYARHLFENGSRRPALTILAELCGQPARYQAVPAPAMRAYLEMAQRWWHDLEEPDRAAAIQSLSHVTDDGSLFQILRAYRRTIERIERYQADQALAVGDAPLVSDLLLSTDTHRELRQLCDQVRFVDSD